MYLNTVKIAVLFVLLVFFHISLWPQQLTKIFKMPGDDEVSFVLMQIPAGEFEMGSFGGDSSDSENEEKEGEEEESEESGKTEQVVQDEDAEEDEMPLRKVKISKGFYMLKHEVTQKQWKAVMGPESNNSYFLGDDRPVEQVSWFDCIIFLNRLSEKLGYPKAYNEETGRCISFTDGFRLPTEAEWEYCCKSGSVGIYRELKTEDTDEFEKKLKAFALFGLSLSCETRSVEQFLPNPWGLYDMHGNVFEWCNDWYDVYDASQTLDPEGPRRGTFKVIRGGGLGSPYYDLRAVNRGQADPNGGYDDTGFRFVLPLTDEKIK